MAPHVVLVAGTGTEVGKTWVASTLAGGLRAAGCTVAARKPAQSFAPGSGPTDADLLAAATGEVATEVCPRHRWYETPLAPPMAAEALARPGFTIADLVAELDPTGWDAEVVLVESAGGIRSPLADDGDTASLARALEPDRIVLVADAGLGTINSVRLSVASLGPEPTLVFLNRFDPGHDLHVRNRAWLSTRDGFDVVVDVDDLVRVVAARAPGTRTGRGKVEP